MAKIPSDIEKIIEAGLPNGYYYDKKLGICKIYTDDEELDYEPGKGVQKRSEKLE